MATRVGNQPAGRCPTTRRWRVSTTPTASIPASATSSQPDFSWYAIPIGSTPRNVSRPGMRIGISASTRLAAASITVMESSLALETKTFPAVATMPDGLLPP